MKEMISRSLTGAAPVARFADLQARLVDYASRIGELGTPNEALDALHAITTKCLPLRVLGAVRFPVNAAGGSAIQLGKSVPRGDGPQLLTRLAGATGLSHLDQELARQVLNKEWLPEVKIRAELRP